MPSLQRCRQATSLSGFPSLQGFSHAARRTQALSQPFLIHSFLRSFRHCFSLLAHSPEPQRSMLRTQPSLQVAHFLAHSRRQASSRQRALQLLHCTPQRLEQPLHVCSQSHQHPPSTIALSPQGSSEQDCWRPSEHSSAGFAADSSLSSLPSLVGAAGGGGFGLSADFCGTGPSASKRPEKLMSKTPNRNVAHAADMRLMVISVKQKMDQRIGRIVRPGDARQKGSMDAMTYSSQKERFAWPTGGCQRLGLRHVFYGDSKEKEAFVLARGFASTWGGTGVR